MLSLKQDQVWALSLILACDTIKFTYMFLNKLKLFGPLKKLKISILLVALSFIFPQQVFASGDENTIKLSIGFFVICLVLLGSALYFIIKKNGFQKITSCIGRLSFSNFKARSLKIFNLIGSTCIFQKLFILANFISFMRLGSMCDLSGSRL